MGYNGTKTRTWNKSTPADGDLIDDEIDRIYGNTNYLVGLLDNFLIFSSLEEITPSASKPVLDISVDHANIALTNYPQLIPFFRGIKLKINNTTQFDVITATKYDANSTVELELSGSDCDELLNSMLEDLLYDIDSATVNGALIDNWGFVVKAVTDIGDGAGKISAGTEMYVKFTNSDILNTLNSVGLKLGVAYSGGANPIGTISGAKIEIYPFRKSINSGVSDVNSVRWRKVDDAILRTGITGSRVRDRFQGHKLFDPGLIANEVRDTLVPAQSGTGYNVYSSNSGLGTLVTDGVNGTPRIGLTTRDRSLGVKMYLNTKEYIP